MLTLDDLRPLSIFEGLTDEQLSWIAEHGEVVDLEADERLFNEGDPADYMFVIVHGAVRLLVSRNGQQVLDLVFQEGSVTGMLPFSRMKEFKGRGLASAPSRVLRIHKRHFPDMLHMAPELGERLVAVMSNRVRDFSKLQQQREKMMALGRLSAGLAHELNNPAAAIRRDVAELEDRLERLSCTILQMCSHDLTPDIVDAATHVRHQFTKRNAAAELSPLQRNRQEDDVAAWLEDHGVEDGYELAGTFVDAGLTPDDLEEAAQRFPANALPDVLAWIETYMAADHTLKDIQAATGRISELVSAVKSYSYMDQALANQPVDVQAGLDNTLTILGHKLKKKSIRVVKEYKPDLPTVCASGGELNQIWTNLIDNAVDAMEEGGELRISTRAMGPDVFVEIVDTGHGIPPDIQSRIFDPFFTTKGVGEGTGLGLDIVHRIIDQHHGEIHLESRPGRTTFTIRLPRDYPDEPEPVPSSA